ncbi:MAG: BlaI/MecI/CopY family transcriptional regulator [Candidatus Methanoperedens sp.]
MVRLDQIDLSKDGLNKFFSPIETRIMKTLWSEGEMTTTMLTEKTDIPLTSVAVTVDRLVKAGFAMRHLELINGRIKYFYEPIFSEKEIATIITNRILDRLVDAFGPLALENFSKYSDKK